METENQRSEFSHLMQGILAGAHSLSEVVFSKAVRDANQQPIWWLSTLSLETKTRYGLKASSSVYLLESDVLMFEWKYWLLSLASKKKKRISSVLILSVENPLVSQWTMYHCILTLIFRIAWLALQNFAQQFYRFSSYNESLWKRDWSWLYNWKASQLFFFFWGLISLFAALGLQSLYSKQKFHNLYKVSALVRMVLTQWCFWWGKLEVKEEKKSQEGFRLNGERVFGS